MSRSAATANTNPTRKRGNESIVIGKRMDALPRLRVGLAHIIHAYPMKRPARA